MKTKEGLFKLLERWREISLAERDAISSSDWRRVEQCQSEKRGLRMEVDEYSPVQRFNDSTIQRISSELISLESANATLVSTKRVSAENDRRQLERASRNLRQVQRAYGSGKESVWNSYS